MLFFLVSLLSNIIFITMKQKHKSIIQMLNGGATYTDIQSMLGVSPTTIVEVKKKYEDLIIVDVNDVDATTTTPTTTTTTTTTTTPKPVVIAEDGMKISVKKFYKDNKIYRAFLIFYYCKDCDKLNEYAEQPKDPDCPICKNKMIWVGTSGFDCFHGKRI